MDLSHYNNVYKEMIDISYKHKDMVKILNKIYNERVLIDLGLPPEIFGLIFSYLSLGGLVRCSLACSLFQKEVIPLMQAENMHIETLGEWEYIFKGFNKNISILSFDATKCYLNGSLKLKNMDLPKLKKIILNIAFSDQLDILKTIHYKPLDIEIITCSDGCDGVCLGKIIKRDAKIFGKNIKISHKSKLKKLL